MTQVCYSYSIPILSPLIGNCIVRYYANIHVGATLQKFDSHISSFVSGKYIQDLKSRRKQLNLSKEELGKLCNVSPGLFDTIENHYSIYFCHRLENALEGMRYDRTTRNALRLYKQEFPALKPIMNKNFVYKLLIKTLFHEVLLEKELQKKIQKISESKNILLWKIHDSLVGFDSLRYV